MGLMKMIVRGDEICRCEQRPFEILQSPIISLSGSALIIKLHRLHKLGINLRTHII